MMKPLFLLLAAASAAVAADPVASDPAHNRLLLENERVRVFETRLGPGEVSASHSHPDFVAYLLTDARLELTPEGGEGKTVDLKAGAAAWNRAQTHTVGNQGSAEARILHVELKEPPPASAPVVLNEADIPWKPAPASLPKGTQIAVLEGDPAKPGPFTMRIKFPAGARIEPHWHPADEHATVLSGVLRIGRGDRFDEAKAEQVDACGFSLMPAGVHHFGFFPKETILQLHGNGPWRIVYLK